ncbi:MAG: hypothetical protein P4M10_07110, partial [Verrucomicrobiae bacterium]|nr:hypothetical protein [Verrucomicrobiae bacterium]
QSCGEIFWGRWTRFANKRIWKVHLAVSIPGKTTRIALDDSTRLSVVAVYLHWGSGGGGAVGISVQTRLNVIATYDEELIVDKLICAGFCRENWGCAQGRECA